MHTCFENVLGRGGMFCLHIAAFPISYARGGARIFASERQQKPDLLYRMDTQPEFYQFYIQK